MAMQIWDRLEDEGNQAFGAFCVFKDLGPGRTVAQAAQNLQQNPSQLHRWKKQFRWQERVDAWDSHLNGVIVKKASKDYAKMLERQMKNGKILQERAMRAIMAMDLDNATIRSLHSVVELMTCGWEMERTAKELFDARFNLDAQEMTITIKDRMVSGN